MGGESGTAANSGRADRTAVELRRESEVGLSYGLRSKIYVSLDDRLFKIGRSLTISSVVES